jgi:phospholipase/carboxylesterase
MARLETKRKRIGSLEVMEASASSASSFAGDKMTVVLFHGFGASMDDLAPLANVIQAPKETRWIFPNGPVKVDLGGHHEGRAWFPLSVSMLEKAALAGETIDLSTIVPPGLKKARGLALSMIEALGVPVEKLVIGGFSQGAMLALDVLLNMPKRPAGLVMLSGTLVNSIEWSELSKSRPGFRFFQSHGIADQVLSHAMALKLNGTLKSSGWMGELVSFRGGHEIPSEVLIQLGAYLRTLLV